MLIKDVDNLFVQGNLIQRNKYGITVEGTPNSVGASATFIQNTLALNDTGIGIFPNAPITFVENAMIENMVQVEAISGAVLGGALSEGHETTIPSTQAEPGHEGHAVSPSVEEAAEGTTSAAVSGAIWSMGGRGNYWSDYRGYDADGDGVGDRPYRPEPPFAGALADDSTLRLFQFTLAQQAIDMAGDMFPIYQYAPVIEDPGPLTAPPGPALPDEAGMNREMMLVSVLLLAVAAGLVTAVMDADPIAAILRFVRPGSRHAQGGSS
jgi:nitrous oxidase accessory protein